MSEYDFLKIFESIIDEADVSEQEEGKQDSVSKGLSHHKASKSKKKKEIKRMLKLILKKIKKKLIKKLMILKSLAIKLKYQQNLLTLLKQQML